MEFAVVTPRSRCSHRVHSRVFGRGIQESEFTQIRMARPTLETSSECESGRIIASVAVQGKAQ